MNRWDQIQGTARDVADWVCANPDDRNKMADDLIKLVSLMIQATGKGVAVDGERSYNSPEGDAFDHARWTTGEGVITAAKQAEAASVNGECDLERYERAGLDPVWVSKRDRSTADHDDDDDTVCLDRNGDAFPEHDYNEVDCRRCGAEPEDGS